LTPALLAALRNAAASQNASGAAISPQLAAILAATQGQGGAGNHGMQQQHLQGANHCAVNHQLQQSAANSHGAPLASHLHRLLHKEAPKVHPPQTSSLPLGALTTSNHAGMQKWNLAQLGKME
jgi:hypothetical protein